VAVPPAVHPVDALVVLVVGRVGVVHAGHLEPGARVDGRAGQIRTRPRGGYAVVRVRATGLEVDDVRAVAAGDRVGRRAGGGALPTEEVVDERVSGAPVVGVVRVVAAFAAPEHVGTVVAEHGVAAAVTVHQVVARAAMHR